MKLKNFDLKEFDSPDLPNSGKNMDKEFLRNLDELRTACGFPFVVTSGYRTQYYNTKVGGVANSAHTRGLAVDIACVDSHRRYLIVYNAPLFGITRIGIGKNFIHLDMDRNLVSSVIWLY